MKRRLKRFIGVIGFWVAWPLWWALLRGTQRTRVLCVYEDEVLLVLPTLAPNRWSLPGGGIREGEDPAEAACRELHEEIGVRVEPGELQMLAIEPANEDSGIHYHCHYYAAVLSEQPVLRSTLEIADARWLPRERIDELMTQQVVKRALTLWEAR